MEESDRDMYKEIYLHIREPIWIYAKSIYNESNLFYETNNKLL